MCQKDHRKELSLNTFNPTRLIDDAEAMISFRHHLNIATAKNRTLMSNEKYTHTHTHIYIYIILQKKKKNS